MLESEIKYTVPDTATLHAVGSLESIGPFEMVEVGEKPHTDTYFDTNERSLFNGKAVLRLRERESGSVLTFKTQAGETSPGDGIHRRTEVECPWDGGADAIISGSAGDTPPMQSLAGRFGDTDLHIVMTAENRRHVFNLMHDGREAFELVLDDVIFEGPGGNRRVLELEVESLGGSDDDLETIAALVTARFPLSPAGPSKYILGMELVGSPSPHDPN